ncbi:MAG: AbiV family abortive infection protein [Bacteroidia bacterium]
MNNTQFNNLSITQAKEGFRFCTENADIHYKVAEILAGKKMYPIANSHLILATEEATKAIFLYFKARAIDFEYDVKKMFFSHSDKHKIASENYGAFYEMLLRLLHQLSEGIKVGFTEEYFNTLSKTEPLEAENQKLIIMAFDAQIQRLNKFNFEKNRATVNSWWKEADQNKITGFYVDYKNNSWFKPSRITKDDYELSHFLTWNIVLLVKSLLYTGAKLK